MASHLQIVLREDVDKLGVTGDVVRVRAGYARNFLIPRGMAVLATRANVRRIEHERQVALKQAAKRREQAKGLAAALEGTTVQVAHRAGESGKLYGSVTASEVASALQEKGFAVDRKQIVLPEESIRQLGSYELRARLASGVEATFRLEVVEAS